MDSLLAIFAFALGAIIGSFLNVVIHRYPLGESLVFPGSRCPHCGRSIRAYDNVPILSYVLLRGRCRFCRAPISIRYVLVELANALFFLAVYLHVGVNVDFILLAAIVSMTIVLIYIDLDIQILPDVIDLPGIGIGIGIGLLEGGRRYQTLVLAESVLDSVIGALMGAGILLSIATAYKLVRKIEGMGFGDVKMLAMIGAVVGWKPLLPVLFIASIGGAIIGLILGARSEKGLQLAIPFGVFLGLATFTVIFTGNSLLEWYRAVILD
jgi:leader peptidase (prepilin peptidase) / N-methyltransferase